MPIRINLKELFSSDGQALTVDKINFNFNKLLELGIGLPGGIGFTGPEGSAGPVGLTGGPGKRGNKWYVGSGDPNTQTFTDLLDDDFYIDVTNSSIWQYDSTSNTWSLVIDLGSIVNNYLAAAGSPFVRGFGESSPDDNRFIVFSNHGNNNSDVLQDTTLGNSSNNDILFLNNFNEKFTSITNFPLDLNDEYNALQKIYADATSGLPGRYHLELGILYNDSGDKLLSSLKENLKIKYVRSELGSPYYLNSNTHLNIAKFILSVPEIGTGFSSADIDYNSIFEFNSPKYNNNDYGAGLIRANVFTRIGSKEALGELSSFVKSDGILFSIDLNTSHGSIGLAYNYQDSVLPSINNLDYLMIDHSSNVNGIFLHNKVYQDNGSITQLGTSIPSEVATTIATFSPTISAYGRMGMAVGGHVLFTVSDFGGNVTDLTTDAGYFNLYSIENPTSPKLLRSEKTFGITNISIGTTDICDIRGNTPYGSGVSDVALLDNFAYIVNNESFGSITDPVVAGFTTYSKLPFQILQLDYNQRQFFRTGSIPFSQELEAVSKIKLYNNYAITASKNYETDITGTGITYGLSNNGEGRINAIDVNDNTAPVLITSFGQNKTNYLALDVIEDYAITLTHEQGPQSGGIGTGPTYVRIYVDVFNLKNLNPDLRNSTSNAVTQTINLLYSTRTQASAFINDNGPISSGQYALNYPIEKQFGAITGTKDDLYVAYKNTIKKFNLRQFTCYDITSPPAYINLAQDTSFTVSADTNIFISDIKLVGKDLYVLAKLIYQVGANTVKLMKFDVSNPLSPIKIYETGLTYDNSSRFIMVGKVLYLCTGNGDGGVGLSTIEVDGINTGSAEIRSLRSNNAHVTDNLTVGNTVKVNNTLLVGKGGIYSNRLSTNQIWGNLSIIDSTSLPITPNSIGNMKLNTDAQFNTLPGGVIAIDTSNADRTIITASSNSTFITAGTNASPVNLFSLTITPVRYDRRLFWNQNSASEITSSFYVPTNHNSYMRVQYGFGTAINSYTTYRNKLVYNSFDGDEIIIPAGMRLVMIVDFIGAMSILTGVTNSFTFRAQKIGLGAVAAPILGPPPGPPPGPGGPGA